MKRTKLEDSAFAGLSDLLGKDSMLMKEGSMTSFSFGNSVVNTRKDVPVRGRSLKTILVISMGDSARGGVKTIQVNRMIACRMCANLSLGTLCERCKGDHVVQETTNLKVDIPPGVENGYCFPCVCVCVCVFFFCLQCFDVSFCLFVF